MAEVNPKPKRGKRIIIAAAIALVALLLIVLLIPKLLSVGPGKSFVVGKIDAGIDGNVAIDSLSLSWTGPQRVDGLTLTDPDGGQVLTIASIDAPDLSLLHVIGGGMNLGAITITGLDAVIEESESGETNLQRAAASSDKNKPVEKDDGVSRVPAGLSCRVELSDAKVTYKAPAADPVVVHVSQAQVDLTDLSQIKTALAAKVSQADVGGSVNADITLNDLIAADGEIQPQKMSLGITADATDVPTALIDRIADQRGLVETLLGHTVTAKVNAQTQGDRRDISLAIDAPNLQTGQAKVTLIGDSVALPDGLDLQLTVTPQAWATLTDLSGGGAKAALLAPFAIKVAIASLSLPDAKDVLGASLKAQLDVGDIELKSLDSRIGAVALRGATLMIDTPRVSESVTVALSAQAEQGEQTGGIVFNATLNNPVNSEGAFDWKAAESKIAAQLTSVPLVVLDQVLQTGGQFVEALGPTLDAQLAADVPPGGTGGKVNLVATAQHLNASVNANISEVGLSVDDKSQITLAIQPPLWQRHIKDRPILQPVTATLAFRGLTVPKTDETWLIGDAAGQMDLAMSSVSLAGKDGEKPMVVKDPLLSIKSERFAEKIDLAGQFQMGKGQAQFAGSVTEGFDSDHQFNKDGFKADARLLVVPWLLNPIGNLLAINDLVGEAIGEQLDMQVTVAMKPATDPDKTAADFVLKLTTAAKNLAAQMAGSMDGDRVSLTEGSRLSMNVTPAMAAPFLKSEDGKTVNLAQPTKVDLTFNRADVSLDDLSTGSVDFSAAIDKLAFTGDPTLEKILLQAVNAAVRSSALGKTTVITATGDLRHGEQAGKLDAAVRMDDVLDKRILRDAHVNIDALPVALVDLLSGQEGKLLSLLGEQMNLQFTAKPQEGGLIVFEADAASPQFALKGSGQYVADKYVRLHPGANVSLVLTSQSFLVLMPPKAQGVNWVLREPATLNGRLQEANFGLPAGDLRNTKLAVDVVCDDLKLVKAGEQGGQSYQLKNIQAQVDARNPAQSMALKATADLVGVDGKTGRVHTNTTITNPLDEAGKFSMKQAVIRTDTRTDPIPSDLACALAQLDPEYAGVVGPTVTLAAIGDYPGDMTIMLAGQDARIDAAFNFNEQRLLTLRQPATAQLRITPAASKLLLGKMHPVLADADANASREPLRLTVNQLDMPLALMDAGGKDALIGQSVADAKLELGTLTLNQSWLINGTVKTLLKFLGGRAPADVVETRFTPLVMSLRNGVVTTNDMWLQSQDAVLGVQGTIQPLADQFRLSVGIDGTTFHRPGSHLTKVIRMQDIIEVHDVTSEGAYVEKVAEIALQIGQSAALKMLGGDDPWAQVGAELLGQVTKKVFRPNAPTIQWPSRPPLEQSLQILGAGQQAQPQQPVQGQPQPQPGQRQPQPPTEPQKPKSDAEAIGNVLDSIFNN